MAINLLLSQFTLLLSQYGHDWVLHYFHFRFPMNLLVTAYFHFPYFNGKESIISYNLFSGLLSLSLDIGNFYASLFSQLWQCCEENTPSEKIPPAAIFANDKMKQSQENTLEKKKKKGKRLHQQKHLQ